MKYLEEGSAGWEKAWAALKDRVGSLDHWQYLGPIEGQGHKFRLRAGMPGAGSENRWETISEDC